MTAKQYRNIKASLRAYCVGLSATTKWYIDRINETPTETSFAIVKSATEGIEDMHIRRELMNINLFAKELVDVELLFGTIYEAITTNGCCIPVKNYVDSTLETLFFILITGNDWANIGETEGYYQMNIGLHYEIIEN